MKILAKYFFVWTIFIAFGCNTKNDLPEADRLSTEDSLKVAQEVIAAIDAYTQAHSNMDAQKAADFHVNSPEFVLAENAELYPNWETLAKGIKDWYATAVSAKFVFENKKVLVLSKNSAAMTGKFNFEAILKNKKKYAATGYATIILVKQNDGWRFYQEHESYKVITK
jgi:ketosteroid isomerase-like protein